MLVRGICIAQMPLTFIHTIINSMLLFPPEIILELTLYIVGEVAITIRNTVMLRHDSEALIYKNLTCRFTSQAILDTASCSVAWLHFSLFGFIVRHLVCHWQFQASMVLTEVHRRHYPSQCSFIKSSRYGLV